ncbi:TonB-dependent receptor [Acetobacteraceae bacterium KSS8]|uniref:TonB-dependent receptor n=1 Tax=Endosaccharibacter trunci TaxID=2812733 RepID=A0ABT1W7S9_9PROT|nr:TonB-dependent receptor [Acetobacteraceae bacterium KSS8]
MHAILAFNRRKDLNMVVRRYMGGYLTCTFLAVTGACAYPAAAQVPAHRSKRISTVSPLSRAPAPTPSRARPVLSHQDMTNAVSSPETIQVRASGHQAGGGRLPPKTEAVSYSMVTRAYIASQPPQGNVFQLAQTMPGANVVQGDPYGVTNNSTISIRGMGPTEIAFLSDGVPQNAADGGTLSAAQFVDNENVKSVTIVQGASDISVPSFTAVGGVMSYTTLDPADTPGAYAETMFGSYQANKQFIRAETGEIGDTGVKGWVSFSSFHDRHFNGPGIDNRLHSDAHFIKEWGDGNSVGLVATWAQNHLAQYYQPTLAQWQANGASNYYAPVFAQQGSVGEKAAYWQNQKNMWDNYNFGVPVKLKIDPSLRFESLGYLWTGRGNVTYGSSLPANGSYFGNEYLSSNLNTIPYAAGGVAPAVARFNFTPMRIGQNSYLTYHTGLNTAALGYWYESDFNRNYIDFVPLGASGLAQNSWLDPRYSLRYANGQTIYGLNYRLRTQVNGIYIKDDLNLLQDRLHLSAGIKVVMMHRDGLNRLPGPQSTVTQNIVQPLPQMNASYDLDSKNQVFLDAGTGFRAPTATAFFNAYNLGTGSLTTNGTTSNKSEFAIKEEIGYRHQYDVVNATVTLFNYNFTNRQVPTLADINGSLVSTSLNAGGTTARGVDVELSTRPFFHLSPYVSFEYIDARLNNNLLAGNDYLPTTGKFVVMTPKVTAAAGLTYANGGFTGSFDLKYMSKQYSSFMNDQSIPHILYANLGMGYEFGKFGFMKSPKIQLNLSNLGNAQYLSGVASVVSNVRAYRGVYGTPIAAGGQPTYYIGPSFAAILTMSSAF